MELMFGNCTNLANLNISYFNFSNCKSSYLTMFDNINSKVSVIIDKNNTNITSFLKGKNIKTTLI